MTEPGTGQELPAARKRPRPVISCLECRRKKLKCDRLLPCQQCLKLNRGNDCSYAAGQQPERRSDANSSPEPKRSRLSNAPTTASTPNSSSREFDELQARVQNLEAALRLQTTPQASPLTLDVHSLATLNESNSYSQSTEQNAPDIDLEVNWSHTKMMQHFEGMESYLSWFQKGNDIIDVASLAASFRAINRILPTQRNIDRLSHYNEIDDLVDHMLRQLPNIDVCSQMVGVYFRNFEHSARILHRPSFMSEFEMFKNEMFSKSCQAFFVPVLIAVVSIASSLDTLHECVLPDLHADADGIGPVQLLQRWLELVPKQDCISLNVLQVKLLLLKPHKSRISSDLELWKESGDVVRHAMMLGLHKEPSRSISVFQAEIRRRLWVTVVEEELFLSIACGMPALCPSFQIRPPLNIDDQAISEYTSKLPVSQSSDTWTDGSCQNLLAQSFNERLRAYELVTAKNAPPYEQVLKHTRQLEQVIRNLPQVFRLHHITDEASNTPARLLAKMEVDFYLRRPLNACYLPFARNMPSDDRYREARELWIQSCLYSLCFQDLFDPIYPMLDIPRPEGLWNFFYNNYGWELQQGLLSTSLDIVRTKNKALLTTPSIAASTENEFLSSRTNIKGWSYESLIKSMEDTLHPLVRRVGRERASMADVIWWIILFEIAKFRPEHGDLRQIINKELRVLVVDIKDSLLEQGIRANTSITQSTTRVDTLPPSISDIDWFVSFIS